MIIQPLEAADNKVVRRVRSLMSNRGLRERQGLSVLEGSRLVEEAHRAGARFRTVLYGPQAVATESGRSLVSKIASVAQQSIYVSESILAELSEVETSQGILVVASMPEPYLEWPLPSGGPALFVAVDGIQDPGNLGTIIRSAQAAGCHGIGLIKGTVDVYNPKTLRASAGSVFEVPLVHLDEGWVQDSTNLGLHLVYSVVQGGKPPESVDWTKPTVLVVGNEGHGIHGAPLDQTVSIPMVPTSNSLNVAAASAVLLFHAAYVRRQANMALVPPVQGQARPSRR